MAARHRWAVALSVGFLVLALTGLPLLAQPPQMPKPPSAEKGDKEAPKPDFPPFEEAMKEFQEVQTTEPSYIKLWYNKKADALRAQLPASLIGQRFLIATSVAGGPAATGFQLDHYLAYFDRMDKKLVLMRVDPRYVEGKDEPVSDVIKRSYGGDIILQSMPIVTMKGGDPVIDLDALFKADFAGVSRFAGGNVGPDLSKWKSYKAFPQNLELTVDQALMQGKAGRRILVHYSLSQIPESAKGYQPREADDRIGYFLTVRKDWTRKHEDPTLFHRYVNRWRLEKRDPSAELSAPKNPIVWYIEKTVPLKYRRWVKEGLLEWNKAFEKCGFLDAVEVIQQEDYDSRTCDLDPEDVRYNFFRWIVTGNAFAMGPSRAHPETGQIFDADIVCDDSFVRVLVTEYEHLSGGDKSWEPHNPFLDDFLRTHPRWVYRSPWERLLPNVQLREDPDETFRRTLMQYMCEQGRPVCECAAGMIHQMEFARLALEAEGVARNTDEFLGQMIKELVMHEVGHCLGLRHNFKGSTWLDMDEIVKTKRPGEANVASIMDYNPAVVVPRGEEQGSYTTRSIGPYDYWAIEYGYRPVGKPYKDEDEMLKAIAGRAGEAGLDFGTDEDTMSIISPDPYCNRYDLGRDPIDFAEHEIELTESLLKDLKEWAVKDGQSYYRLRRAFGHIISQRAGATSYVARLCGGQVMHRTHKGDANARPPFETVPAEKQREALRFVCENVFTENAYKIDPELLSYLAPGRFNHWDSDEFSFRVEYNIHDVVAGMQYRCLFMLMNPFTIIRIQDNQVKFGEDQEVYTLAEHINDLTDAIWSELNDDERKGTDAKPFINSFRRNLQRQLMDILLEMVLSEPGTTVPADANAITRLCVANLSKKINQTLKTSKLDTATKAHLVDVKNRIDKALEAEYFVGGQASGGAMFFFFKTPQETSKPVTVLPKR